jgi:hypothetical protein
MNGKPLPFAAPAGTPIVGQPFTVTTIGIPMNMGLTCNCGGDAEHTKVDIQMSVAATCQSCGKVYNAIFNPQNGQVQMSVGVPAVEKVPS